MCNYNELNKDNKQAGFTLLEITFVFIIFGLIVAMFSPLYSLWLKNQAEITTQQNTSLLVDEITEFLAVNGRYPCPAPLGVTRDDTGAGGETLYGRESTECADSAAGSPNVATGDCDASTGNATSGICVETSQSGEALAQRIIIGAVPFRELNIPENQSYDGYDNRITYAVTEVLTQDGNYAPELGGIRIIDTNGEDVDDDFGIHFIVYSHGENGYGAYNYNGVQLSCADAAGVEAENCFGAGGNAEFLIAEVSTNYGDATEYDDVAAFIATDDVPHFKYIGDGDDIEFMNAGNTNGTGDSGRLGMLLADGIESSPQEELDVGGNVRAQSDLNASQLCTYGNDSECFNTELFAGDNTANPDMRCPDGQYMVRLESNRIVCQEEVVPKCTDGEFMVGVDADGRIICDAYNPPECQSVEVDLCPANPGTYTLPVGQNNDVHRAEEISGSTVKRYQKYRCKNGSWQPKGGAWGTCNCVAGEIISSTTHACGTCQTGTYDRVKRRKCPSGSKTFTENSTCGCDPDTPCSQTRSVSCDPGFDLVGDPIVEERFFNCLPSGQPHPSNPWGSWSVQAGSGTCECTEEDPIESTMSCNELDITLTEKNAAVKIPTIRYFDCGASPPSYRPREFDDNRAPGSLEGESIGSAAVSEYYCQCNTSLAPQTRQVACSSRFPGTTGVIDEKRDYDCGTRSWGSYYPDHADLDESSTEAEVRATFCTDLPIVICRWQKGNSVGVSGASLGAEAGSVCDCDMDADDKIDSCHDVLPGGTTFKNYTGCECG